MKKKHFKLLSFFFIIFVVLNFAVYSINLAHKNNKIQIALNDSIKHLETHYKIFLDNQSILADAAFTSLATNQDFFKIFSQAEKASKEQKKELRAQLYELLSEEYRSLKNQGVLQYQFIFPDNSTFLRMHKPSKFGDDLTVVRPDVEYVNIYRTPVKVFTQGRVAHGFRNTYPLFDDDAKYLGAAEISFSSDSFQNKLKNISHLHTHFIVSKKIFEMKSWERDDLVVHYEKSIEHPDYLLSKNGSTLHAQCPINNKTCFESKQKEINRAIEQKKKFSTYIPLEDAKVTVASFLPIYDIQESEVLAWIVSYENSPYIASVLELQKYIQIGFFIFFLILEFLLYRVIVTHYATTQNNKLINDILDSTEDIIFITDCSSVSFSNRMFKKFFGVESEKEFQRLYKNASSMFVEKDGYLHTKLQKKGESFVELLQKTAVEHRVVLIEDKLKNKKSFNINITKLSFNTQRNYLITLTDITKMKEREEKIRQRVYLDALTGINNRVKFDEVLHQEFKKALRYKTPLALAIIDIDNFKKFNDTYGHLIGDEVLIMLANTVSEQVRESDTFARWGGEEFAILFTHTNKDDAERICEKLRATLESSSHPTAGNFTASFGVTQLKENDTIETLFQRCDQALYLAKEQGKNRVCTQ